LRYSEKSADNSASRRNSSKGGSHATQGFGCLEGRIEGRQRPGVDGKWRAAGGALHVRQSRFESGGKTDPEELIAAAHAACFSMALSGQLGQANLKAESIATTANLTLEKTDAGMTVTSIHLAVKAKVPGADRAAFDKAANNAKAGCPISRLLNAKITLDAVLE
jgi:osmotically inducible protein OsmC